MASPSFVPVPRTALQDWATLQAIIARAQAAQKVLGRFDSSKAVPEYDELFSLVMELDPPLSVKVLRLAD